ncbi:hypothetical protein RHGRI_024258 [Rhododendron griersonianum]|uniref:Uncharacterized protein n=1 Tax=Rhododendron griersonianum TaxID=479676 RepID=A0AAV6JDZ8_9ERIC|nr:hypothetical protein RHGRI_024258 [Rhododendron griersonianum]
MLPLHFFRPTPISELLQEDACSDDGMESFPSRVNEPKACQHSIPHIEESVAMPSIHMDEPEMCHPSMPPRNLEEEFLAVATAHAPHAQSLLDKELLAMPGTSLAPIHRLPPGNQSIDDDELEDESTNIRVDPQANR